MTPEDQELICKCLARANAWGSDSISLGLDELNKGAPQSKSWVDVFNRVYKQAVREKVGVVTDLREARSLLSYGYWLANEEAIFNPPPMNGLHKFIDFELYKQLHGPSLRVDGLYQDGTPSPSHKSWPAPNPSG